MSSQMNLENYRKMRHYMHVQGWNLHPMRIQKLEDAKHIFSHVEWRMQGYMVEVDSLTREEAGLLFVEAAHSEEKLSDTGGICGIHKIYEYPSWK